MSVKINPPTLGENYERYKQELEAWKVITDVPKKKQGIAIALTLPDDHPSGIRAKVFEEIKLTDLDKGTGLDSLLQFMDKNLGKDDITDQYEKFEEFEDYRRSGENITEYIANFHQRYIRLEKLNMTLPKPVLAFKLLKSASLTKEERMLVLTGMDFEEKEKLYDQAKSSLKKFMGDSSVKSEKAIKFDPAFLAENEEALLAAGYERKRERWRNYNGRSWKNNDGRQSQNYGSDPRRVQDDHRNGNRKMNPNGRDGKPLRCRACGSYRHFLAECPDRWEFQSARADITEEENETAVLFTGAQKRSIAQLGIEAQNSAVLDSACSSTVCGKAWFDAYLDSLSPENHQKVIKMEGEKVFRFGGGEKLKSIGLYIIPVELAGKKLSLKTDVVESAIPLLLSKSSMKKAKIKLDTENDTAEILGVSINLNCTSSGHYCVPIVSREIDAESVCAVKLENLDSKQRYNTIFKLHRQFAHPSQKRMKGLMQDAGVWRNEYEADMEHIYHNCQLCKVFKTVTKPAVALPLASRFNERVCMDLKKWRGKWILHMIDMFSRFSVSVFIDRKRPSEVINKVFLCWIGAGFGVMESMLTDNGGEFSSDETREVASILNIEVCTTAAESPFQNGLCERNHAVVDNMLMKMEEQCPDTDIEVLLAWANMAKNALQMWNGFSSYQLVFGKNPNLPNIMNDNLPALQGSTSSEILSEHLNALHAARQAFVKSEADERIKRALRSKVRVSEQVYKYGDRVYYKRDGHEKWLGPGKVIFQDGKVVFVRHGAVFVRVSTNRLMKAGLEIAPKQQDLLSDYADEIQNKENPTELTVDDEQKLEEEITNNTESNYEQKNIAALQLDDRVQYRLHPDEEWKNVTVLGRAGKATGKYRNWYNVREENTGSEYSLDFEHIHDWKKTDEEVNAVLLPKNRHNDTDCIEAKEAELQKLKDFNAFEEVDDMGQKRISTRWIICQKGDGVKARLVARGFEDDEDVRRDSPTIGKSAMRTIMTIAAYKRWTVKTTDIKSAFLQGETIKRDVYIKPPKEANYAESKLWKLNKCLYGLNEAARQFYQSVTNCMLDLGCERSSLEPALFYFKKNGEVKGMMACHIDDFLHAGDEDFETTCMKALRHRFLAGKLEEGKFKYVGFQIQQNRDGIIIDQSAYVEDIENINLSSQRILSKKEKLTHEEHTQLRELVGRLNWAVQGTRPDMTFDLIDLSTKFASGVVEDLQRATKCIKKLKEQKSLVYLPCLNDMKTWRLVVYTDAALANLHDGVSSMGARLLFLVDDKQKCCLLSWHAGKVKRVVRSTIAAEALSLLDGIEDGIYMKQLLKELLGIDIPIEAIVDNRSVVEAVHSTKLVEDKRLRIDVAAIQECLSSGDVVSVRWCPGSEQLANCMTKRGASTYSLQDIMHRGILP